MNGIESLESSADALQLESVILFVIICRLLVSAWGGLSDVRPQLRVENPGFWTGLISTVLFGMVGFFLWGFGGENILLAVEFALGFILALVHPTYAACFFLSLLFLRPWEVMEQNAVMLQMPRLVALSAIGSWLFYRFRVLSFDLIIDRSGLLLLGFAAWIFISTFKTPAPAESQAMFFDTFLKSVIIFFLTVNVVRTPRDFETIRGVILLSIGGLAVISLYQSVGFDIRSLAMGERLKSIGILENSNDIAAIMIMGMPMALIPLLDRKTGPLARVGSFLFCGLALLAVWYSQSRGALLAVLAVGAAWALIRSKNKTLAIVTAAAVLALALPAMTLLKRDAQDLDASRDSRIIYWKAGLSMAQRNPVLGVGFNRYPYEYESYAESIAHEWGRRTAHSTWILALAEGGVPAFLLLIAFVFGIFRKAYGIILKQPDLFLSLVGYGIVITFLSHTYLIYPYILFGLVVAANRIYAEPAKEPSA